MLIHIISENIITIVHIEIDLRYVILISENPNV